MWGSNRKKRSSIATKKESDCRRQVPLSCTNTKEEDEIRPRYQIESTDSKDYYWVGQGYPEPVTIVIAFSFFLEGKNSPSFKLVPIRSSLTRRFTRLLSDLFVGRAPNIQRRWINNGSEKRRSRNTPLDQREEGKGRIFNESYIRCEAVRVFFFLFFWEGKNRAKVIQVKRDWCDG